jgi:hypothetical protein
MIAHSPAFFSATAFYASTLTFSVPTTVAFSSAVLAAASTSTAKS